MDEIIDLAKRVLSDRQYNVWHYTTLGHLTAWEIAPLIERAVITVHRDRARARAIMALAINEAEEGRIRLGTTVALSGHETEFRRDETAIGAHRDAGTLIVQKTVPKPEN